ncbi:MAG: alpha/beta fold hydrolase [Kordiimonadaceae bacterium]|nr:alpha/beta fold hydrolase [Kordiimonadaceae bacterium]
MVKKILAISIIVIFCGAAVLYVKAGWNDLPFDAAAKEKAPGSFVQLHDGNIHYYWVEPTQQVATGEIVVMSHGYGIPGFMFQQIADILAEEGHRVLIYDHFGHGYSDRPSGPYDQAFFERELNDLVTELHIETPFFLVGQSMGGLIAAQYAAQHPEKVKKLALFVPAGLRMYESKYKLLTDMLDVPLLGEWIWRVVGRAAMYQPLPPPCDVCGNGTLSGDRFVQARYEGYFAALLDILRHFPMKNQDHIYQKLAEGNVPTLALFGEQDELIMPTSAALLKKYVPRANITLLPEGDHELHIRHWRRVGPMVANWFNSNKNAVLQ